MILNSDFSQTQKTEDAPAATSTPSKGILAMKNVTEGPQTVHDLCLFLDQCPDQAHLYRPNPHEAAQMGLDPALSRKPEPFPESYRRRLIATCRDDAEFCFALRLLLIGGEA